MHKTSNKVSGNWGIVNIDQIGVIVSGGTPSTKEPSFWNEEIAWITPADLSGFDDTYISRGERGISKLGLQCSSAVMLPKGSILFSSRAPIGYVAIAKNALATNQGFKNIVVQPSINPKFVYYYLKTIRSLAIEVASGTTFLELSAAKFKQLPFPLPPTEEQDRIVSKIDELYSEIDRSLHILRESINKAEFTKRKFLERYFSSNPDTNTELGTLLESINYGYTAKSFLVPKKESIRYLRITDIQEDKIIWDGVPYCDLSILEQDKFLLRENDIVFARSGNTVGKTVLIKNPPESVFASYLINVRCKEELLAPNYLSWFFKSPFYWNQIDNGVMGIGQPNFNGKKLSKLQIPVVPLDRQKEIAELIEAQFSDLNRLVKEIQDAVLNSTLLKSKILEAAFCGKLSQQLETDSKISEMLLYINQFKEKFKDEQLESNKRRSKIRRNNPDLKELIFNVFKNEPFAYSELFNVASTSKTLLLNLFEKLEETGDIISLIDEKTGTLKYKLV